jgi:hypothetical protein
LARFAFAFQRRCLGIDQQQYYKPFLFCINFANRSVRITMKPSMLSNSFHVSKSK